MEVGERREREKGKMVIEWDREEGKVGEKLKKADDWVGEEHGLVDSEKLMISAL